MARPKGIKQPHPLGSVATRAGVQPLTVLDGSVTTSTGVKISELIAASAAIGTDQIEVNQAGSSRSITVDQLLDVTGGAYLPLAGGTLTGGLTGTTATLSGALTGTTAAFSGEITTATPATADNDTTAATTAFVKAQSYLTTTAAGTTYLALTGGTLVGALTGTTATFSGTVTAPGHQIQMVSTQTGAMTTGTTIIPYDDTIPQITEGNEYMTLSVTPKSATSKLIIEVVWNGTNPAATSNMIVALFQDSTANALAAVAPTATTAGYVMNVRLTHTMTSGTTSATTFRVRAGFAVAGTTTFNGSGGVRQLGGVMASSIVIREVAV